MRIATIAVVLGLGAFGLAQAETVLRGPLAWFAFVMCVLSGWGYVVVRVARVADVDFGLRAAWGIAGYLAVAGVLIAIGVCSRPVILVLIAGGAAGFAWRELATPRASWQCARDGVRWVRAHPVAGSVVSALVAIAVVRVVGAVAALERNPWDDDLAYTPLVRRLLDVGDLVEPFAFRRLAAYGGQTALQGVIGARGSLANVHLFDQGICFAVALLAIVGYARERMAPLAWVALLVLVVELLPNTAINTASYWSGAALLFALYRTIAAERWTLVGVVGAAACTLRQSYLPIVVVLVGVVLLGQLVARARVSGWRAAWLADRRRLAIVAITATVALAAWCIAMQRSSDTFLFPLVSGTFNDAIPLRPSGVTWASELGFLVWCSTEPAPIAVVVPLFLVLLVARDRRPGMPLIALFAATVAGFVLLVHAFAGYEAHQLWRYSFGPGVALLAAMVLDLASSDEHAPARGPIDAPRRARWVVIISLAIQLVASRTGLVQRYKALVDDVRDAAANDRDGDPAVDAARARYAALQASLPAGATVAVMLDEPYHLDFARNRIVNLDTPGYASPAPHLRAFGDASTVRMDLVTHGIRYVAFVRSSHSRAFFRRPFWLWRLFNDAEPFQVMSAYTIDAIDNFAALAREATVLHDADGLVALDLGGVPTQVLHPGGPEPMRRAAFVRALADREGLHAAWSLSNRADLLFEDGVTGLGMPLDMRGTPTRWTSKRAHLRVRGDGDHRLVVRGSVDLAVVHARPRLDVVLDGQQVTSTVVDDHGAFAIDTTVEAIRLGDGWHDLYLVWSNLADPAKDTRDPRFARLGGVEWEPR